MSDGNRAEFPCPRYPEDAGSLRLLGLYDMRAEGLVLQRIRIHAGRLDAPQLRVCAELARQYTPGFPLHLTTRQDVELHGLKPDAVPAVQRGLAGAGLTTLGAAGDTPRNVTVCPGCGLCAGSVDVSCVADRLRVCAETLPWIRKLPRKFKISVSGCENAAARPWINDVGLIANADGTFRAIVAGSLGAKPGTGFEAYSGLGADEVVPLTIAALRLFNAEGDRENRARARLRHVRERLGDAAFIEKLDRLFREEKETGSWPAPEAPAVSDGVPEQARLRLPLGDIEPAAAIELANAIAEAGATLRIGFEHDLFIYGPAPLRLSPDLEALNDGPSIVACPGSTWCERGIASSRDAAAAIRLLLPAGCALCICLSGCPNNCTHAAVADIGFTGRMKTIEGTRTECFRLVAGGDKGRGPALAEELRAAIPADRVGEAVKLLAAEYAQRRSTADESFGAFVRRKKTYLLERLDGVLLG
ncbi:MAG: nitrite/sulfite reductase [Planctomycetota bacterium]